MANNNTNTNMPAGNASAVPAALTPERIEKLDSVVRSVVCKMTERAEVGHAKYGQTMDRTDLGVLNWIQHAQEEAMDFVVYLEKLKQVVGSTACNPVVIADDDDDDNNHHKNEGRDFFCMEGVDNGTESEQEQEKKQEEESMQTPKTPGNEE